MTIAVPPAQFATPAGIWQRSLVALAIVVAAILILFARDVADLTDIWWTSTTFGHCLFILPVVAWLVWTRRQELSVLTPVAWWPGLAIVAVGGFGWLLGDAASVALARHLGVVMMVQGAVVAILGPNVARGLLFPLAYLIFAVPFGEVLEAPLQSITVAMIMPMLDIAGVPARVDGVLIHAGRYYFEVAEACSGAKFVIAMLAYGALVANVCFHSWRRRAVFMVVAFAVPVVANGIRAFGTIYAAHLTSIQAATGVDHIIYGWVFFALVMALVMAVGWRWFDRTPDDPAFDPAALLAVPKHTLALVSAAAFAVATAAIFPMWSAAIAGRAQALPARIDLPAVPGWTRAPIDPRSPWMPWYPGADHFLIGRYRDANGRMVDVAIAAFASQHEGKELVGFGTGILREGDVWVRVAEVPPIAGGSAMRITAPGPVERVVATWYRVGKMVTADERRVKIETMKAHLLGGPQRAVALHVSAPVVAGQDPSATIARFAAAMGRVDRVVDRTLGMAR